VSLFWFIFVSGKTKFLLEVGSFFKFKLLDENILCYVELRLNNAEITLCLAKRFPDISPGTSLPRNPLPYSLYNYSFIPLSSKDKFKKLVFDFKTVLIC